MVLTELWPLSSGFLKIPTREAGGLEEGSTHGLSYEASHVLAQTPESLLQRAIEATSVSNINFSISWGSIKIVILKLIHVLPNDISPEVPAFAAFHKNGEVSSVPLLASSFLAGIHIKYKRSKPSLPNELYGTLNYRISSPLQS